MNKSVIRTAKSKIPWQAKILAKIILSRFPGSKSFCRRLHLFEHGEMTHPAYAFKIFKSHFDRVDFPSKSKNFVALEFGPGDSLFSALIAYSFGATVCYMVDVGNFATKELTSYIRMLDFLKMKELPTPSMKEGSCLDELLEQCGAVYTTDGLASLSSIPDGSVDFVWSQAVCEHIRRKEFFQTMQEIRRIISPNGICSHNVDLKDHLGGSLNNLRFRESWWESDFMARSGFYTNRIRFSEMIMMFDEAGFEKELVSVRRWDKLPMQKSKLARSFRTLSDDELMVSGFEIILRPA